jgi:hypothetical protein
LAYRLQKDGGDFYFGEVVWRDPVSGNDESSQVFGNIDVLRAGSDPLVKEMNGDGTFRITPAIFYQMATINTIAYGHVSFIRSSMIHNKESMLLQILCYYQAEGHINGHSGSTSQCPLQCLCFSDQYLISSMSIVLSMSSTYIATFSLAEKEMEGRALLNDIRSLQRIVFDEPL